jgi:polyribonucleotide 5'-hydroxyl-kinase
VIRLEKSGGCVDRDETYMKAFRQAQIRAYFFGHAGSGHDALGPNTQTVDIDDLTIYKIVDGKFLRCEMRQGSCTDD